MLNAEMVRLAREAREMTQKELAVAASVNQGTISKVENGIIVELEDAKLVRLADALSFPVELFLVDDQPEEAVVALFNRKLATTPAGQRRAAQARVNLARFQLTRLLQGVELEAAYRFPTLDVDELDGDMEYAAQMVRRAWRMPMGPVKNLTAAVEAAGGIVSELDFGTLNIDAASQWPAGDRPYFFVRPGLPPDRYRFNLAHEIGHMVLHDVPDPATQEPQAHQFAGALLVPADELRPQVPAKLTLAALVELKQYWGVSMAMLVIRAEHIGAITDRQKRSYFQMANARGMRRREPGHVAVERPTVVSNVVSTHLDDMGYSRAELARVVVLLEDEFQERFLGETVRDAPAGTVRKGLRIVR